MLIKNAEMLVTDVKKSEGSNNRIYYKAGMLSLDDGQKFDVSLQDEEIFLKIQPMTKIRANLSLTNTNYGMRLTVDNLIHQGDSIVAIAK